MILSILEVDSAKLRKYITIKPTTLVLPMTALAKCLLSFQGAIFRIILYYPLFNTLVYSCLILPLEEISGITIQTLTSINKIPAGLTETQS